jgi:hypothetical protein
MNEKEREIYRQLRNVSAEKAITASKASLSHSAMQRFKRENTAREAALANGSAASNAMRTLMASRAEFEGLRKMQAARRRHQPSRSPLAPPYLPPAPRAPSLKLGSMHLVDTLPLYGMTWQASQVYGGVPAVEWPVSADGTTGNMSFNIAGGNGQDGTDNNSTASCWCAIGQAYTFTPSGLLDALLGGNGILEFSATPSFNWAADYWSVWYQLASGTIWIGQTVFQYDTNWTYVATPVSYEQTLYTWSDHNLDDFQQTPSGNNTGYPLSTYLFVQPEYIYTAWVVIGATVYGNEIGQFGESTSIASMNANVSSLIFDSY